MLRPGRAETVSSKHIVQLSFDHSVFSESSASDSRRRQRAYATLLCKFCPNSRLTIIVLSQDGAIAREALGPLFLISFPWYRIRHIVPLVKELFAIHRERPIDLITTQNIHGVMWAGLVFGKMAGVPVLGQYHDDIASALAREANWRRPYGRVYEFFVLKALRLYDCMRVVNFAAEAYLREIGYRKKIAVVPVSGINPTESRAPFSEQISCETGALRVLYVGRMIAFKNLRVWIEAAHRALQFSKSFEFVLVGEGGLRKSLEALRDELGLRGSVRFVGSATPDEVFGWYSWADVLLLTSSYEAFGRVVVEAMHQGVVPVCSSVSGPKDIVENEVTGFLSEPQPEPMAAHLLALTRDRTKLRSMGEAARLSVREKYAHETLRRQWVELLIENACKTKTHTASQVD